jgi:PTS system nitrogen regulatory IIA component
MNVLADLLHSNDILLDLDALSKKRVFEEVGRLFDGRHGLSKAHVEQSLGKREDLGSTGLGHGVAIPHARIASLQRALGVFVRTRLPIPFDAPDEKPVSDMFVLLVPEKATEAHLQILAAIAEKFSSRAFRDKLRSCGTADEVCRLFSESGDSETAADE